MNKKFHYWHLSEEVTNSAYAQILTEEKLKLEEFVKEQSAIVRHDSLAQRLVFEDGIRKGWIATHLEKMK